MSPTSSPRASSQRPSRSRARSPRRASSPSRATSRRSRSSSSSGSTSSGDSIFSEPNRNFVYDWHCADCRGEGYYTRVVQRTWLETCTRCAGKGWYKHVPCGATRHLERPLPKRPVPCCRDPACKHCQGFGNAYEVFCFSCLGRGKRSVTMTLPETFTCDCGTPN